MKKLMIAMGAAAMMSLCANAVPTGGTSLGTGTGFNSYAGDWDPTKDDNGTTNGKVYWTGGIGDSSSSEIKVRDPEATPADKYLKVDETEELTRLIDVNGGVASNATVSADSGIYFSSKVQFTAMDNDNEPAVSNGVDKIIVWAKAPKDDPGEGDPTTTNLMVTALNPDTALPDVYDTGITVDAESWYDLVIVASPTPGDDPVSPISFTVKLGNNTAPRTYLSMVRSGADRGTISSASFKGTGAVDDIDWGTVEAVVVPDVTVTIEAPTGVTFYDAQGVALASNMITTNAGATVKIYVVDDEGTTYSSVSSSVGTVGAWDSNICGWPIEYTTTAANTAVTMTITVTEGGKTPIADANVTLSATEAVYTESLQLPTVTVVVGQATLTENTDYTVSWVPAAISAEGGTYTVTVTGTGAYTGTVVKTFKVTAPGGETAKVGDTEYTTGADFVAAATSGTVNTLPSTWTVEGNTVKDGTGATFATFPEFYTVSLTGTTLTLELNNKALDTVGTMTAVTVGTNFGLSVSASNVKLYYGLASCATVNGTYAAPAKAGFTQGTGSALTLNAAKGVGSACFYKLYVTDVLPNE